jgi:response regulator of citrate/malate metabolism
VTVKVTYSTMGVSTPASVAEGTGYYRDRGKQPHQETGPSSPLPQNIKATTAKQKRMAKYTRLRLEEELSKEEAAERLGISRSTARYYENDLKDQQRREAAP